MMEQEKGKAEALEALEAFEVELDEVVYVTNELTGFQDQELAKLFAEVDLEKLVEVFMKFISMGSEKRISVEGEHVPDDSDDSDDSDDIEELLKLLNDGVFQSLMGVFDDNRLVRFLSIILVPKEKPVYREETAEKLAEVAGDLTNPKIVEAIRSFFIINRRSVEDSLPSTEKTEKTNQKEKEPTESLETKTTEKKNSEV